MKRAVHGSIGSTCGWTSRLPCGASTAYLWIENVLGTDNVLVLYRATGQADTDGFLDTPNGQAFVSTASVPESASFNYDAYAEGAANIGGPQSTDGTWSDGRPRQLQLGLRFGL